MSAPATPPPEPTAIAPAPVQEAQWRLGGALEEYVELCRMLDGDKARAGRFWSFVEHQVRFTETRDVIVSRSWQIASTTAAPPSAEDCFLPIHPTRPEKPGLNEIQISSPVGQRVTTPVPSRSIEAFVGSANLGAKTLEDGSEASANPWKEYLAVPVTRDEFLGNPIVKSTATLSAAEVRESTFRKVRPVANFGVSFPRNSPVQTVAVTVPDGARATFAVVRCSVDWGVVARWVEREFESARASYAESNAIDSKESLKVFANRQCSSLIAYLLRLRDQVDGGARATVCAPVGRYWSLGIRVPRRVPEAWTRDLVQKRTVLNGWLDGQNGADVDPGGQVESVAGLVRALEAEREAMFVFATSIASGREVKPPIALQQFVETYPGAVTLVEMDLPFTTEKSPDARGRRSALDLGALAVVSLLIGALALDWPGSPSMPAWLASVTPQLDSQSLVAVLLIFPAALYGQFFQTRPQTPLAYRAGLQFFSALSASFILPVFPAVWLALGRSAQTFAILCLSLSAIYALLAMVAYRLLSPSGLKLLRSRQVLASKRWKSARVDRPEGGGAS